MAPPFRQVGQGWEGQQLFTPPGLPCWESYREEGKDLQVLETKENDPVTTEACTAAGRAQGQESSRRGPGQRVGVRGREGVQDVDLDCPGPEEGSRLPGAAGLRGRGAFAPLVGTAKVP